jgi:soluble lytic murein transglycosylase-like protein
MVGIMSRTQSPQRVRSLVVLAIAIAIVIGILAVIADRLPRNVREEFLGAPVTVPAEYVGVIYEAAERCPAIPVNIFAAQLHAESGWDPNAVSHAGAQGIAQFMPPTWEQYGIDADGDGVADVWNPIDAIHSAASLNCVNRKLVAEVSGKRLHNTLAAYNAGFGSVRKYDGVPPFPETENYLQKILKNSKSVEWEK